ncbi:phage tail protein, partial [Acinetobacter sp. WCHAc060007]|uniref:phage tail protein n=1 Tax=Acinetobacter sp. WCHAc060007 TaxID=2419605 RepID=UPI000EA2A026
NFTSGDEQGSYATITTSMMQVGRNVLFVGAVDGVPSGSDVGIYLGVSYSTLSQTAIEADINPAHIIRECLTNPVWGIGVVDADIDDMSFRKSADTLYTEKMGMSIKWDDSTSIEDFIDIIKKHINAELYFDKSDAKWKLYLIRADYNANDLDHLNESHVQNLEFERRTLAECINSVTLTYWDRERSKDSTVTVQDIARIAQQGGVVSQSVEYRGFTNSELASRIAYRELQTLSANLASVSFDVTESQVQNWHLGKPFKLSDISYGLSGAIFRVKEMRFGDGINNTVSIDAVEDSFSSPMQSIVEYVPPIKTSYDAKDATAIAFEVPYIELVEQYGQDEIDVKLEKNPDLSYVGMAAIRPNNSHINAALFSDAGAGYDEVSTLDFCPAAELKIAISYTDSVLQLQNVHEFNLVKVSNRLQIGSELMSVVSFDAEAKTLTVKRGVFDTVPTQHLAGAMLFVWDNYSGLDSTDYLSGEAVALKALTQTNADQLNIAESTAHEVQCVARAICPYPPANVQINGEYYPAEIETDLILTWVDRNRLQQTGGDPLSYFEGAVTAEADTLYQLVLIERDENASVLRTQNLSIGAVNTFTFATSAMHVNTRTIQIVLRSLRDSYESYQAFDYTVELSQFFSAPYDLTVEFKND